MSGTTTTRDVAPVDRSLRHVASGLPDASKLPRLKEMFGSDEPKRMSRRRRIAADARPLTYGEAIPIDRAAIHYSPGSTSGPLGADAKPCPPVRGETFPIAD